MTERWEGATGADLALRWQAPAVHAFHSVASTNDVARGLAAAGAPAGTVVVAETQTAGRGRGGKAWSSNAGLGLWMSVVLRPERQPGLLPILVGLGVAEALDPLIRPAKAQVKWPNDVLIGGRKVCGILCEGVLEGGGGAAVVAGIGLNVAHQPADFPHEVADRATSLRIAAGWTPPLQEVAGAVLAAVMRRAAAPPEHLGGALMEALAGRDALTGRRVRVEDVEGTALGINAGGALLVRVEGVLRTIHAGSVSILG